MLKALKTPYCTHSRNLPATWCSTCKAALRVCIHAFVFPGQGSQSLGMLKEHGAAQSLLLQTFAEASEALGYDLWALCQKGPAEQLDETDKTQPAILTASIALWRLWLAEGGVKPAFVAGHSLGEYSALVASGSLSLKEAVKLVETRL